MDKLKPPAHYKVEGLALKIWKETAKALEESAELGLVPKLDVSILAIFCRAMSNWIKAEAECGKEGGSVQKSPTGPWLQQTPWVAIAKNNQSVAMKAATQLGLSPAARNKLKVTIGETEADDGSGEFI